MSDKVKRLMDAWEQVLGSGFWYELTNDELYQIEAFLWAAHQDAVLEWSRRRMRATDPKQ